MGMNCEGEKVGPPLPDILVSKVEEMHLQP